MQEISRRGVRTLPDSCPRGDSVGQESCSDSQTRKAESVTVFQCPMSKPAFDKVSFAARTVKASPTPDGGLVLASGQDLKPFARCVGDMLEHWARVAPDRTFIAERARD